MPKSDWLNILDFGTSFLIFFLCFVLALARQCLPLTKAYRGQYFYVLSSFVFRFCTYFTGLSDFSSLEFSLVISFHNYLIFILFYLSFPPPISQSGQCAVMFLCFDFNDNIFTICSFCIPLTSLKFHTDTKISFTFRDSS